MCDINKNLEIFGKDRKSNERYASFDYCFNYFQGFKNKADIANPVNIQNSCLQLGFYLASWGMLRGASFLLEKSVRHYSELIKEISNFDKRIWNIDVDNYNEAENIKILIKFKERAIKTLGKNNAKTWDTLVTKIMLGIFGNVPAYDTNFKRFLKEKRICQTFNKESLEGIENFYKDNQRIIYDESKKICTLDFDSGEDTKRNYTKAKIIDMVGFIQGQTLLKN